MGGLSCTDHRDDAGHDERDGADGDKTSGHRSPLRFCAARATACTAGGTGIAGAAGSAACDRSGETAGAFDSVASAGCFSSANPTATHATSTGN